MIKLRYDCLSIFQRVGICSESHCVLAGHIKIQRLGICPRSHRVFAGLVYANVVIV